MDNTQIKNHVYIQLSKYCVRIWTIVVVVVVTEYLIFFFFGILHISSFPFSLYWCVKSDDDGHQIHDVHDEDNTHWQRKIISYLFLD